MPSNDARLWRSPDIIFSRRRLCVMLLFFALPLLLGAKDKEPDGPVICREGFLEVVSPDKVSVAECKDAVKMVMEAWQFDLGVMHWAPTKEMDRPLTLRVRMLGGKHQGVRASADQNGNRFTMNLFILLRDRSGPQTLAHELAHTQAFRVLGRRVQSVPNYFIEGHGLMLDRLYADHLRLSSPKDWIGVVSIQAFMTMSPKTAEIIFTDRNYGDKQKDPKNHFDINSMGVYLVEYMRTRVNGKGIPDTVPKMGRVFEQVGRGKTYEQAFKDVYGVSVNQVASQIVELFKCTESNPAERFKGTRFEADAMAVAEKSR
jgi:hypothetical protein